MLLAFVDADDLWVPGRLARMTAALGGAGIVSGAVEPFISPELPCERRARLRCPQELARGGGMAGAMVISEAAFRRVGPFDESLRSGEVVDWYLRAVDAGVREVRLAEVVLRRRIHESNHGLIMPEGRADYLRVMRAALHRRRGRPAGEA